jgi:hypothetical protein
MQRYRRPDFQHVSEEGEVRTVIGKSLETPEKIQNLQKKLYVKVTRYRCMGTACRPLPTGFCAALIPLDLGNHPARLAPPICLVDEVRLAATTILLN